VCTAFIIRVIITSIIALMVEAEHSSESQSSSKRPHGTIAQKAVILKMYFVCIKHVNHIPQKHITKLNLTQNENIKERRIVFLDLVM
jgi:hypothetical protein